MSKKIKWGFIQPLTGGFAIGAEKAIGSAPDWVLSFPGFCGHTENPDGTVKSAMNEYHYLMYTNKSTVSIPYIHSSQATLFITFATNRFNPISYPVRQIVRIGQTQ